ncbi:MAG: sigma-E processing peptidase SpoIIGA [Candidatus Desulforudis sp.]|nr:sigma-E processing peptidase SpoIIGA [Desulforudis sp.]
MVYTVYLDEVLLGNVLMNFAILWLTARLCLLPGPIWRLICAATLGAVYAVALLFPVPVWLTDVPAKVAVSFLMLAVAFFPQPGRKLGAAVVVFYLVSFGLGGLVFGLGYFVGGGGFVPSLQGFVELPQAYFWPAVLGALVVTWLVGRWGGAFLRRRYVKGLFHVPVRISLWGKSLLVTALVDTGNQLSDPLNNHPVLVVELDAVRQLLPEDLQRVLDTDGEPDFEKILSGLGASRWATRLRLIPFQSLGRSSGLLLGFRPDQIEISCGREVLRVKNVVVAVYQRRLCPEATYRALVNPRLLETAAGFS